MNKTWVLTQESFDALLDWLGPDREQAGLRYEEIRTRLIKIFTSRGCYEPEDLADETINRVIKRVTEIEEHFEGDQARYFYGVANKVHMEYRRRTQIRPIIIPPPDSSYAEAEFSCLEQCLEQLTTENRELLLQYYQSEGTAKIERRKIQAQKLGIAVNALRIRAYRIRTLLQACVEKCLDRNL